MRRLSELLKVLVLSKPVRSVCGLLGSADKAVCDFCDMLCRRSVPVLAVLERRALPHLRKFYARSRVVFSTAYGAVARALSRFFGYLPWSCILGPIATVIACIAIRIFTRGEQAVLLGLIGLAEHQVAMLKDPDTLVMLKTVVPLAGIMGGLATMAALLAFARVRLSHFVLKACVAAYIVFIVFLHVLSWRVPALLNATDAAFFPSCTRNELWMRGGWLLMPCYVLGAVFMLLVVLRSCSNFYRGDQGDAPLLGDRILDNLKTHGPDPRYRKSTYTSAALHIFCIFVLPFLLFEWGCEAPYGVPKGSGVQAVQVMEIKKVKKKKEKKYILNLNTAISFYIPKIDESEVFDDVDKQTQNIYEVKQTGKLGEGDGKEGGWPDGMDKARVRFIRLEYKGGDWDQDMGVGADYNMLLKFREITGFKIWTSTESIRINRLKRFPKRRAPPFVYLTGGLKGSMSVSNSEVKTLRTYCLKMGGMIFADNGGGNFDRNLRALLRRTFPELPIVEIAYDDIIFRHPFPFPRGAPPLWHHSGNRALGVKYQGRWVVFYHQGDINDAWKDGHSGVSAGMANRAYRMGVNVINYGFTQYMRINWPQKKR